MSKPLDVNAESFERDVLQADRPVLVDFWATWCGPCKALAPILEEMAGEPHPFGVAKINADENQEIAQRYGVMGLPTMLLFDKGQVVKRVVGYMSKDAILSKLA